MSQLSAFLAAEKKSWVEHTLHFDHEVRRENLPLIDAFENGKPVYLGYQTCRYAGMSYQHWFVTDHRRKWFFEFTGADDDIHSARVAINTNPRDNWVTEGPYRAKTMAKTMTNKIRERMRHVIGMSNYSLCLRNCEHVANYVFRGRWVSMQMQIDVRNPVHKLESGSDQFMEVWKATAISDGAPSTSWSTFDTLWPFTSPIRAIVDLTKSLIVGWRGLPDKLMDFIKPYLMEDKIRLINTFPSSIKPHIFGHKSRQMYSFIDSNATPTGFDYYLDWEQDTHNILVVGPTGCGKSHLINVMFNRKICEAEPSLHSVTKEIYFIRGRQLLVDRSGKRMVKNIIVADTIGLCDTDWDDDKITKLLRGRISSNFKRLNAVLVVIKADRLHQMVVKNLKQILTWLNYNKDTAPSFCFICTHSDHLNDAQKENIKREFGDMLRDVKYNLIDVIQANGRLGFPLVFTGFPPEDDLNDRTRDRVNNCMAQLNGTYTRHDNPIITPYIKGSSCLIM